MKIEKYNNFGCSVGCTELDTLPIRMDIKGLVNHRDLTESEEVPPFLTYGADEHTQLLNNNNLVNITVTTTTTSELTDKYNGDITNVDNLLNCDRQEVTNPTKTLSSTMTYQVKNMRDSKEEAAKHSCIIHSSSSCFSQSSSTQTSMVPNVCLCENGSCLYLPELEARVKCTNYESETTSNALLKITFNRSDRTTTARRRNQHQTSVPNAKPILQTVLQLKSPLTRIPPQSPSPATTATTFMETGANFSPYLLPVVTTIASTLSVYRWIVVALFCSVVIPTVQSYTFHNGKYHLPPFNAAKGTLT